MNEDEEQRETSGADNDAFGLSGAADVVAGTTSEVSASLAFKASLVVE